VLALTRDGGLPSCCKWFVAVEIEEEWPAAEDLAQARCRHSTLRQSDSPRRPERERASGDKKLGEDLIRTAVHRRAGALPRRLVACGQRSSWELRLLRGVPQFCMIFRLYTLVYSVLLPLPSEFIF
jgi:hypothetical protein